MEGSKKQNILITGGSGVLGSALIETRADRNLYALTHRQAITGEGISSIPSDVGKRKLGLDDETYNALVDKIDVVIHSAALTDFSNSHRAIYKTNVVGVERLIDFCKQAKAALCYVSTAYIHPNSQNTEGGLNVYERSKLEAETRVLNSGLPVSVVRPSLIVGNSFTGEMTKHQGFHMLIDMLLKNQLPILTASSSDALIDIIPQDVVARAIWSIVDGDFPQKEYWLTAGEKAPSIGQIFDIADRFLESKTGSKNDRPRIVSLDMFERLIKPTFFASLPPAMRKQFNRFAQLTKYMSIEQALDSDVDEFRQYLGSKVMLDTESIVWNNMEYMWS